MMMTTMMVETVAVAKARHCHKPIPGWRWDIQLLPNSRSYDVDDDLNERYDDADKD